MRDRNYRGFSLDFDRYENTVHNASWEPGYADAIEVLGD